MKMKPLLGLMLTTATFVSGISAADVPTVEAASTKVENIILTEGKTQQIQLDGKGAKEKIKYTVTVKENDMRDVDTTIKVTINNKSVYTKTINSWRGNTVCVKVTDFDNSDKMKDILISAYDQEYTGVYTTIDYCRYNNGKFAIKQDVKGYLETLKNYQKVRNQQFEHGNCDYFHPECVSSFADWNTTGDKNVNIGVCVQSNVAGYMHGLMTLKFKDGKLAADANLNGKITEISYGHTLEKKLVAYTTLGGSTKAFTAKAGERIDLDSFQIKNGKLYIKIHNSKNQSGWFCDSDLSFGILEADGTLHM